MATQTEKNLVYAAGVVQGIALVTFPAANGIAAFGIGPLLDSGVQLSTVYALAAVVAAVMGVWSFVVASRRPSPATIEQAA
jgi:hypothetical protein